jgi:hypothetical protein
LREQLLRDHRGARLKLRHGDFNADFGLETRAFPDHLSSYRVLPDEQAEQVEWQKRQQARLSESLDLQRLVVKDEPETTNHREAIAHALRESMAHSYQELWQLLRAIDAVLAKVQASFNGVDPLKETTREKLQDINGRMLHLGREFIWLDIAIETLDPDEEMIKQLRRLVDLDAD